MKKKAISGQQYHSRGDARRAMEGRGGGEGGREGGQQRGWSGAEQFLFDQ